MVPCAPSISADRFSATVLALNVCLAILLRNLIDIEDGLLLSNNPSVHSAGLTTLELGLKIKRMRE